MNSRKILVCVFMLILVFVHTSFAEISCDCGEQLCTCFIQMGDEGIVVKQIITCLYDLGYISTQRIDEFDRQVYDAVVLFQSDRSIRMTGMCDDPTLSALVGNAEVSTESDTDIVWIPTDGGKKYHAKPACSGMNNPRKISMPNAVALQIEPCKRCYGR